MCAVYFKHTTVGGGVWNQYNEIEDEEFDQMLYYFI